MAKRFQPSAIPRRQSVAGDAQKFPYGNIQKNRARFREIIQISNSMINLDLPAEFMEITCERVGNLLRAATWNGPAHGMPHNSEHERKSRGDWRLQRKKRV